MLSLKYTLRVIIALYVDILAIALLIYPSNHHQGDTLIQRL